MKQIYKQLGKVRPTVEGNWSIDKNYTLLSIVYDEVGNASYISRKDVPAGIQITNKEYWTRFSNTRVNSDSIVLLSKIQDDGLINSYDLQEAIDSFKIEDRRLGTFISFYEKPIGESTDYRWNLYQFNSNNIDDWNNTKYWQSIYYIQNKFLGLFSSEESLKRTRPFPIIGDYAFVGATLKEAVVYRCNNIGVWTRTNEKAKDYLSINLKGDITISEEGNWVIDGVDTGISSKGENGKTPLLRIKDYKWQVSYDGGTIYKDIPNSPIFVKEDDEDIVGDLQTDGVKLLKFADKEYNASKFSGLGKVYLRKNIVNGKNVLTQEMINKPNTIYIIQYDYDLNGETLILPKNSNIYYNGGSIKNGILKYNEKTNIVKTGVQKGVYYLKDFVDYNENYNPADMRDFLQRAIDYVAENGSELIFPTNKTFTVRILPNEGITEDKWGIRRDDGDCALNIPSNIIINLSGSTIQAETNKFATYSIIKMRKFCKNGKIINGNIFGDRDNHIIPSNATDKTHEWNIGITIEGINCLIENCILGKLRGDGINASGEIYWNHIRPVDINKFTNEKIDNKGNIITDDKYKLSPMINVDYLLADYDTLFIRGITEGEHSYDVFYDIHYYDEYDNWLGYEKCFYSDVANKPKQLKAKKIRFVFEPLNIENLKEFYIMGFSYSYNTNINNCEIFECGRNGIVVTTCINTLIDNCRIHDIGGTNNEVGIDIEGTPLLNGNCEIKNTIIEKCNKISIAIPQGNKIIINNCVMDNINGMTHEYYITNSIFKKTFSLQQYKTEGRIMENIWYNNKIENCRFYNAAYAVNSIFENCCFYSGNGGHFLNDFLKSAYIQTLYNNCVFIKNTNDDNSVFGIYNGIYKNCRFDINCKLTILQPKLENLYITTFDNCIINCKVIERDTGSAQANVPVSIKNSTINQISHNTDRTFLTLIQLCELINNNINLRSDVKNLILIDFNCLNNTIIQNNIINCNKNGILFSLHADNDSDYNNIIISNNIYNGNITLGILDIFNSNPNTTIYFKNNFINNTNNVHILYKEREQSLAEGKCFIENNKFNHVNLVQHKNLYYKYNDFYKNNTKITLDGKKDSGTTEERPILTEYDKGLSYFDTTLNKIIYWNGTKWIDANNNSIDSLKQGTTAQRPTGVQIGFTYKDTDLNKWIIWNGEAWENIDGTALG